MKQVKRMKYLFGTGMALALAAALASTSPALAAGSQAEIRSQDVPTAEATISSTEDTLLVHTQTPAQHSVCADSHGTGDVVVKYDDNETTISPGHCALLEAGQISAHASKDGMQTHVTVHSH